MIILPPLVYTRWQQCHEHESALQWRSMADMLAMLSVQAYIEGRFEVEDNCKTLSNIALEHYRDLMPHAVYFE